MPRKSLCCVDNCQNSRQDAVLHKLPVEGERLDLWFGVLNRVCDLKKLVPGVSMVCGNHFEQRFKSSTARLFAEAYPSLFTSDEISTGTPSKIVEIHVESRPKRPFLEHYDHNYSKQIVMRSGSAKKVAASEKFFVEALETPQCESDDNSIAEHNIVNIPSVSSADHDSISKDTVTVTYEYGRKNSTSDNDDTHQSNQGSGDAFTLKVVQELKDVFVNSLTALRRDMGEMRATMDGLVQRVGSIESRLEVLEQRQSEQYSCSKRLENSRVGLIEEIVKIEDEEIE